MDSNTTLNPGNILIITWVNKAYKIEDRYLPSLHFWDSGSWWVLYFPLVLLSIIFYFLIVCWLIFALFSCFSESSLSSQESILTCLLLSDLSLNFIIFLMVLLHHIIVYYITKLHYSRLLYLILPWLLFSIVFIILFALFVILFY